MMRSMYSAVSGLKTHQTRMDVIGNNIANVNTVAFKSTSVTFQDILYQTTSNASGANANTGVGGVNAKQIGLGVATGATNVNITSAGAAETTGNAFDIRLSDQSTTNFFIVNNGSTNLFTRAGSFYVDGVGNLCMTSTGYTVMGWQVDPATGNIKQDTVSPLRVMQQKNLTSPPEATVNAVCAGVIDKNDTDVTSDSGKTMNLNFYDNLGYKYTAKFAIKNTDDEGIYTVELVDVLNSNGKSLIETLNATSLADIASFGEQKIVTTTSKRELVSDSYVYDTTAKKFYKRIAGTDVESLASDYDLKKVAGFTYTVTDPMAVSTDLSGTFSKTELEAEPYNLVYQETPAPAHYYWLDDVTGTGKEMTDSSVDDWMTVLGLDPGTVTSPAVTLNPDGSITLTAQQTFTPVTGLEQDPSDPGFYRVEVTAEEAYGLDTSNPNVQYRIDVAPDGVAQVAKTTTIKANTLKFDPDLGTFISINGDNSVMLDFNASLTTKDQKVLSLNNFQDISIDFTQCLNYNNGATSTVGMSSGGLDGTTGKGRTLGSLIGLYVMNNGEIYGSYDNGNTELLGQIAVAQFANAAGLEKMGDNCYQTTLNSGDFDGIGVDISADGSSMTSGELEMSNVDLSTEFTSMITTQRGFQANSRVISTSDSLLEELVNLKR